MTKENEGVVAPNSIEAQALAELQKEGHEISTGQPDAIDGEIKDTQLPPKEEVKEEEKPKEETPKEESKPERTPTMVEAWKLKVAEDQKESAIKQAQELQAKIDELSKQKNPITEAQKVEIEDDIKAMAEEAGVDPNFLSKFAESILKKAKPSEDLQKTIQELQVEKELVKQNELYSKEFEDDVIPLVKELNLSDQALSQLKKSLKDLAFSETYAKVPLKEIFKLKEDTFDLKVPKKSSEGKGIKIRSEVVDLNDLDEEKFKNLPDDQIENFLKQKSSEGGWKRK